MDNQPVAWLHTMHFTDVGETDERVTFSDKNAYGIPGRHYSETFEVTIEPLYRKQSVKVKPLEWKTFGKGCWRAETIFGRYEIMDIGPERICLDIPKSARSLSFHVAFDEAFVSAQTDYEARILSAIEIT